MPRSNLFAIIAVLVTLFIAALLLPPAASAWLLNQANAEIARAASLPPDSPDRLPALSTAAARVSQARGLSDLARVPLARARAWLTRGEFQAAADALRSSHAALQDDAVAQFVWGDAEWRAANSSAAFERWRAAGAIEFFMNEANRARDRHQWEEAERLARLAVGIAPERADAHYALGDALSYRSSGDPEALREMDRAAELTRDAELLSTILSRKGEVLAAQGEYPAALDLFDQAMRSAPLDARPRTDYARTLLRFQPDARDRAAEMLQQSIAIAPWDVAAFITLAEIAQARGDVQSAAEWYRHGLARNANDARLLFALGEFYARQNRLDEARATLTLALKYETHADDLRKIAGALAELGGR